MRLVAFTLPHDPTPRTGVLAHDGARVIDLTAIGVASFADGAARASQLARLAAHLLHMPGAVAHLPSAVTLLAPAARLAAVYDAATGRPAPPLAAGPTSAASAAPSPTGGAVPLAGGLELGVGLACVLARPAHRLPAAEAESAVAGVALVAAWRDPAGGHVEATVLGPWLTTLDEFTERPRAPLAVALDAALAVNGEPARGGSWGALSAKLAAALADAAARSALAAGDAIAVVTYETASAPPAPPDGLHQLRGRHALGASPGDEVVVEATRLGTLRARVAPARHGAGSATER